MKKQVRKHIKKTKMKKKMGFGPPPSMGPFLGEEEPVEFKVQLPSDAKEMKHVSMSGSYHSIFKSVDGISKAVSAAGYTPKDVLKEGKASSTEFGFGFMVHGVATKDKEEFWITEAAGFDDCQDLSVYTSSSKEQAYVKLIESPNSQRMIMSRCPEYMVKFYLIPKSFSKVIDLINGKEHALST
mmetsp:Transcript_24360/g.36548  ORF Transcript_24360/g.36548 Transcript_24360/m.36548 type:complete len:184 (-) Transcript_24360:100-651(-)|eukprot:CAMPEP_0167742100 /NCGR_PEP_ID=MMETSP0110_2-20121227/1232_1 /TAXON_ID=629695 /ORGANISM="Gymnochlora sp., Strain CCMP2014" /LENGTH=183 /DNA_ID=CAMNT_0007626241 /DNA_START=44 /DNA_END=595 /DNA_ORIENTATION=-